MDIISIWEEISRIDKSAFGKIRELTKGDGIVFTNEKGLLKVPDYIKPHFYNKLSNIICANNFKDYATQWENQGYNQDPNTNKRKIP